MGLSTRSELRLPFRRRLGWLANARPWGRTRNHGPHTATWIQDRQLQGCACSQKHLNHGGRAHLEIRNAIRRTDLWQTRSCRALQALRVRSIGLHGKLRAHSLGLHTPKHATTGPTGALRSRRAAREALQHVRRSMGRAPVFSSASCTVCSALDIVRPKGWGKVSSPHLRTSIKLCSQHLSASQLLSSASPLKFFSHRLLSASPFSAS